MVAANSAEFQKTLSQIEAWPRDVRLALAQRLLEGLEPGNASAGHGGYWAAEAIALVNSRQPAPDLETTEGWVHERRTEKYDR
jgi:hypothetical protein